MKAAALTLALLLVDCPPVSCSVLIRHLLRNRAHFTVCSSLQIDAPQKEHLLFIRMCWSLSFFFFFYEGDLIGLFLLRKALHDSSALFWRQRKTQRSVQSKRRLFPLIFPYCAKKKANSRVICFCGIRQVLFSLLLFPRSLSLYVSVISDESLTHFARHSAFRKTRRRLLLERTQTSYARCKISRVFVQMQEHEA